MKALVDSERFAFAAALLHFAPLARRAGLVPILSYPKDCDLAFAWNRWIQWRNDLLAMSSELRRRSLEASGDPRTDQLLALWWLIVDGSELSGTTLLEDIRGACRMAQSGRELTPAESSPVALAAACISGANSADVPFEWIYFGNDRKFHISKRALRDRLRAPAGRDSRWRVRAHSIDLPPRAGPGRKPEEVPYIESLSAHEHSAPDIQCSEAEERLLELEACRQVREIVEARRRVAKKGSAQALLLDSFEAIAAGDTTQAQIAERGGLSKSTVSEAWKALRSSIARDLMALRQAG